MLKKANKERIRGLINDIRQFFYYFPVARGSVTYRNPSPYSFIANRHLINFSSNAQYRIVLFRPPHRTSIML